MSMNDSEMDDLRDGVKQWLQEMLEQLGIERVGQISPARCMKLNKDVIANGLLSAVPTIKDQCDMIRNLRTVAGELKTQLIESQQSVIKLQSELLSSKDDQLVSLQKTVETSVQDSVKAEFQSYSSVAQKHLPTVEAFNSETLKKVVKHVVQEEDRSKNFMIFGLPEEPDEQLIVKVGEMLNELGEKPRTDVCRVGRSMTGKVARPVKVTVASSTIVSQILVKARNLREAVNFKSVFISPDRSAVERAKQRQLVLDLKKIAVEEPEKRHFIKSGKICSVDKAVK